MNIRHRGALWHFWDSLQKCSNSLKWECASGTAQMHSVEIMRVQLVACKKRRRKCTIHKTAIGTGFKVQNLSLWRSQGIILSLLFPVVGAVLHWDLFSCCRLYRAKLFHRVPLRFLAPQPQLREKGARRWDWRRPDSVVYGCWKIQPKPIFWCKYWIYMFLCTSLRLKLIQVLNSYKKKN